MMAVAFSEFGTPEVLQIMDKPDPMPSPGEVVVGVVASTVNPTDLMTLSGLRAKMMEDLPKPYTAGMDFAGRVLRVGEGVSDVAVGQPVIGVVSPRRPGGGAQAQEICVPAASVAAVRDGVDMVAAASVPMNALTAILCLDLLALKPGQTLFVSGATGMLGSLAIQLALQDGLKVIANANDADRPFVAGLGVQTILPRGDGLEAAIRATCPQGLDAVIDGALIGQTISHLVRDGGGMVSPRASYKINDPRLKISYVQVTSGIEDNAKISRIARLLGEGKLTPRVAENGVFPFQRAADAYRMAINGGHRGRVMITFAD
jgi:NADPH2:quinone reductase